MKTSIAVLLWFSSDSTLPPSNPLSSQHSHSMVYRGLHLCSSVSCCLGTGILYYTSIFNVKRKLDVPIKFTQISIMLVCLLIANVTQ